MGAKERKEKDKLVRMNDIIDAAEKIFIEKGFDGATMDDIAKEADFSKRTVYVYFNSKERLQMSILLRSFQTLNRLVQQALEEHTSVTPAEQITMLARIFLDFSQINPLYFETITLYENKEVDFTGQDELTLACYKEGEQVMEYLKGILKRGIYEGVFLKSLDVTNTALVLWATVIGIANLTRKKEHYIHSYHQRTVEDIIETGLQMMLRAIQNCKERGNDHEE